MPYRPGDNYCICDLSGKKVLMSETVKTWDGLRVYRPFWYPKHPQLSLRAIPDRMAVQDGRSRPLDQTQECGYGWAPIFLQSPNLTVWELTFADDGTIIVGPGQWQPYVPDIIINSYILGITDDGTLTVTPSTADAGASGYYIKSYPSGNLFILMVETDGTITGIAQ